MLGTLLAIGVETRGAKAAALEALLFAPMIIPDIVLAIALLSFFTLLKVTLGPAFHHPRPRGLQPRLRLRGGARAAEAFDWSLVEASADLGAGRLITFRKVTLPVILPAVIAAALLAFTLSVDEFIIAYFTAGAGARRPRCPCRSMR